MTVYCKQQENAYLPKNLNSTPQIENKEHNWLVVHFLQTTKNDEEDKIPSDHLVHKQKMCIGAQSVTLGNLNSGKINIPYLYKSWYNTCLDYTKSSIQDLY